MEENTLATGGRKRLHLGTPGDAEPHGYVLDPSLGGGGPRFTGTISDPTVLAFADGGEYRIGVAAVGSAAVDRTATVHLVRISDGATFDLDVTVLGAPIVEPEPFTAHLGETF